MLGVLPLVLGEVREKPGHSTRKDRGSDITDHLFTVHWYRTHEDKIRQLSQWYYWTTEHCSWRVQSMQITVLFFLTLSVLFCALSFSQSPAKTHTQHIYTHAHARVCGWVYPHSQTLSHTALQLGPFSFYLCHFVSLSLSLPLCVSLSLWHFLSFFLSLSVNFLFIVFASSGFIIVHSSSCFKSPFCSFFLPWASIVVVSAFVFQRPLITCSSGLTQLKSFSTSSVRPRWKAHLASNPRLLHIDRDSKKTFVSYLTFFVRFFSPWLFFLLWVDEHL